MAPHIIRRDRLTDLADQVLDARLSVVVAPTGSGKTVLVRDWMSALSTRAEVALLATTSAHDSPPLIRAALAETLREVMPALGWHPGDPISPADLQDFVRAARSGARRRPDVPLVIAFDDFEAIADPAVREVFAAAVDLLPADIHLVFASRMPLPFPLARLRRDGGLLEVDGHDLAFTRDEIAQLARMAEVDVGPDAVLERTDGWAAAVALLLRERHPEAAIRHLVDEEMLPGLPAELLDFLLDTAPLEAITVDSADAVRGATDSRALLDELARRSGIPLRAPGELERWRHPPVVREHLALLATRRDSVRAAETRRRAAAATTTVTLSARELEVLELLDSDMPISRIAHELSISYHTAKTHVRSIYAKLDAGTRTAAVGTARAAGFLSR